jgi:hypothetical protein
MSFISDLSSNSNLIKITGATLQGAITVSTTSTTSAYVGSPATDSILAGFKGIIVAAFATGSSGTAVIQVNAVNSATIAFAGTITYV